MTLKAPLFFTLFFFKMSKQILISMLRQGSTGTEILSILDVIAADNVSQDVYMPILDQTVPTLEEIAF
mgnify:CR=1 FL=1